MKLFDQAKRFIGAVTVVASLFVGMRTQGMNLYTYDLDSLVYMSPQIIEGKLGGTHRTNNVTVWEIKISAVHKGGLKVGRFIDVVDSIQSGVTLRLPPQAKFPTLSQFAVCRFVQPVILPVAGAGKRDYIRS